MEDFAKDPTVQLCKTNSLLPLVLEIVKLVEEWVLPVVEVVPYAGGSTKCY